MKARLPDESGDVDRDGVRIHWDRSGDHGSTVLLLPTWSIIHSDFWKCQVGYLARHFRVITFDGRGCGRSDRPPAAIAYTSTEFASDAAAVLDATGTDRAVAVGLSFGASIALALATYFPSRVTGIVAIGPGLPLAPGNPDRDVPFNVPLDRTDAWHKCNMWYWRRGPREYRDFLEFFFGEMFCEPHSTKEVDDCVGWGLEVAPETLIAATIDVGDAAPQYSPAERCSSLGCPVLVIHGDHDVIAPHARGERFAELTGGELVTIAGGGHGPMTRDPVVVNLLIREFVERVGSRRCRPAEARR